MTSFNVELVRANGNLGIASANFATNTAAPGPGIAVPNVDFSLSPTYGVVTWGTLWSVPGWTYSDGSSGANYNSVLSIFNDGQITGNLNLNLDAVGSIQHQLRPGGRVYSAGHGAGIADDGVYDHH